MLSEDLSQLTFEQQVDLRERWNIIEFDGGVESGEAFRLAVEDVTKRELSSKRR